MKQGILLGILASMAYFGSLSAQSNTFYFSVNKDPLESFSNNYGGFVKHNWGFSNGWYLSTGLGFWSWEQHYSSISPLNRQEHSLITIFPETEFGLQNTIEATNGRVGFRQERTNTAIEINVPLFVTFGREWLRQSDKFSLHTDAGLMGAYLHQDIYAWEDWIAIQGGLEVQAPEHVNNFGDPTFWLTGKAVRRSLELGGSINIAANYHFGERVALGLNIFTGFYFTYLGYATIGMHFAYSY